MDNPFFTKPILNSPYENPLRHWELDADGQPTQRIIENRRRAEFVPIPKPRKRTGAAKQQRIIFDEGKRYGRWTFAEFTEVYQIEADFEAKVEAEFNTMIEQCAFVKDGIA